MNRIIMLIICGLILPAMVCADTVFLEDGEKIDGKIFYMDKGILKISTSTETLCIDRKKYKKSCRP